MCFPSILRSERCINNTIVYLIGYGGTGKYTIAKELALLTDAVIVDNQLVNRPVFSVLGADGNTRLPDSIWPRIEGIRRIVLDTIVELAQPQASFLFTNELYEGKPRDRLWFEDDHTPGDQTPGAVCAGDPALRTRRTLSSLDLTGACRALEGNEH